MPKISVIIPAYNAMEYLPKTIDSLLAQTFKAWEAIIIDDGSTDDIAQWFNQLKDPQLHLISQVNQGQSKARNVGIEVAQGEYIAFLDADDLWDATKLQKQNSLLDSHPDAGVVYTWVAGIDSEGGSRGRIIQNSNEGNVWRALIKHNILECGSTPLVRRSCFEKVGVFDQELPPCEDLDLWLRISRYYKFLVVKEPLVYYRQHASSSGKNWQVAEKNCLILLEKAFKNPSPDISPAEIDSLKSKAYSLAYLRFLAWSALQSKGKDYKTAIVFSQKARQYDPKVIFSKDYVRLLIAIWIIQYLKPKSYDRFVSLLYFIRSNFFGKSSSPDKT